MVKRTLLPVVGKHWRSVASCSSVVAKILKCDKLICRWEEKHELVQYLGRLRGFGKITIRTVALSGFERRKIICSSGLLINIKKHV